MLAVRTGKALPIFLASLWLAGCSTPEPTEPPPPEVEVITLRSETAALHSELPGRVVAAETSEVRPQVSGVIRQRLFEEGAAVEAG